MTSVCLAMRTLPGQFKSWEFHLQLSGDHCWKQSARVCRSQACRVSKAGIYHLQPRKPGLQNNRPAMRSFPPSHPPRWRLRTSPRARTLQVEMDPAFNADKRQQGKPPTTQAFCFLESLEKTVKTLEQQGDLLYKGERQGTQERLDQGKEDDQGLSPREFWMSCTACGKTPHRLLGRATSHCPPKRRVIIVPSGYHPTCSESWAPRKNFKWPQCEWIAKRNLVTDFRADAEATRSWKDIIEGVVVEWGFPKELGDRLYDTTCKKCRHIFEVDHCFVLRVWGPGGVASLACFLIVINPLSGLSLFQPHDRMLMDPDQIGETSGDTNTCNEGPVAPVKTWPTFYPIPRSLLSDHHIWVRDSLAFHFLKSCIT